MYTGNIPPEWKTGRISFIPKIKLPISPADLRPICLTSTVAKLFGRILIYRIRKFAPACNPLQLGCHPGRQAMDGINTARAAISVSKRSSNPLCFAKLDIKAAFDSLSHRAIAHYLRELAPCKEALALWHLSTDNEVILEVGGQSWKQSLGKGILQGTSYSAELFSRIIAWTLDSVIRDLQQVAPVNICGVSFPALLIYADDILLFGTRPQDLQHRLRRVQGALAAIGLHINISKSSVLQGPLGEHYGIWGMNTVTPLRVSETFIFLGVPLGFQVTGEDTLFHCLRKTQSSFFAFKRIMDATASSLCTKVSIFETYVSSRWLWASPAVFPTVTLLRKVDSMRNTLLLSLLRLPTDPLLDWVTNEVSRRRGVRILCDKLPRMPQWAQHWLQRFWRYWGHAARERPDSPLRQYFMCLTGFRLRRRLTQPAAVVDTDARKLQQVYTCFRFKYSYSMWMDAAEDRHLWNSLEFLWLQYWLTPIPDPIPPDYLMGKQLVAVADYWATFRPARSLPFDDPYSQPFKLISHIHKDFDKRKGILILLIQHDDQGCSVVTGTAGLDPAAVLVTQLPPHYEDSVNNHLASLLVLGTLIKLLRRESRCLVTPIISPGILSRGVLANTSDKADPILQARWLSVDQRFNIIGSSFLPPKKIPDRLYHFFHPTYNATPVKVLQRSWNFQEATYVPFREFVNS
ncbi:unnamed protein product [Symbiodinium sp. CCMP2592]|nr:unnamed protein product [Symbiodinium sp. CCMP2592]